MERSKPDAAADARQARTGTLHRIEEMLTQRTRMLKLLWQLSEQDLAHDDETLRETLDDFLSVLVDYIAAGHFGLYERIVDGHERRAQVVETARELYPRIAHTTQTAVEFNERYGAAVRQPLETRLAQDLSQLGERLTTRIELEDLLIRAMLGPEFPIPGAA